MKRILNFALLFFLISCAEKEKPGSVVMKLLPDYPSASAVEYINGKLYVMGDDATQLLVLDTNFNIVDSVLLINNPARRIPKNIKPDLESSISFWSNGTVLFFFGSGSLPPYRNTGWWYYFETKIKDSMPLAKLYSDIQLTGIKELNVEGAAIIQYALVLANRGHKGNPENSLLITDGEFWNNDSSFQIKKIPVFADTDTSSFSGISGLCFSGQTDQLIMTASTEDTRSTYEDGAIGKSYLWIVNKMSDKLTLQSLKPDSIIDLNKIDPRFKGYKIESATIISESKENTRLVLVADNDNGSSSIFKLSIKIN